MAATDAESGPREQGVKRSGSAFRRSGTRYVIGRILKALLTIYVVATVTFFLGRLLPGNPVEVYINQQMSQFGLSYQEAAARASALFAFDPDRPLLQQYVEYMSNLLRGDFGDSLLSPGQGVLEQISIYLPWTLFSVGVATVISFLLGILAGMAMAYRRGGWFDHVATTLGSTTNSIPNYLLALMIVVFLGVQWELFDFVRMRGSYSPGVVVGFNLEFILDALYHASLPIVVYVFTTLGGWMLVMKSSTVETLGEDYVTVARARGLSDRRIQTSYVGRNAMLPLFTAFAITLGTVVGGAILVEKIFQYEGVGSYFFEAIQRRDYPIIQGIALILTISIVAANLIADLLYSRIDPRVRVAGGAD